MKKTPISQLHYRKILEKNVFLYELPTNQKGCIYPVTLQVLSQKRL